MCDVGAFALTGNAAGLVHASQLHASAGQFVVSGIDVGLSASRSLLAALGAYALTGNDASALSSRRLGTEPGQFVLVGYDASLEASASAIYIDVASSAVAALIASSAYTLLAHDVAADVVVSPSITARALLAPNVAAQIVSPSITMAARVTQN